MVLALLAIAVFTIVSLLTGAAYLEAPLPGGLPFGNALTALGQCAAAGAAICLSRPGSVLRAVSGVALIAAILWLPVSIALAGNLALNFAGRNGDIWLWITAVTALAVTGSLGWALVRLAATRLGRS